MRPREIKGGDLPAIQTAMIELRSARDRLRSAGAVNAARYVARAIKSAEGAERHAHSLAARHFGG